MYNSPDEFSNCGDGVILYFSFFKFCIIVTFITAIGIRCVDSCISYNYYRELQEFCDNLPIVNEKYSLVYYKCEVYSEKMRLRSEAKHKETILFNSFIFKLSLVNFRNYENISDSLNDEMKYYKLKPQIININLVNFLCLINIFIAY